ncbi:hypothetical protein [Actinomadura decatromicini]|uniref:Uncharacterized protein n=1 Tax=Actinomadura decatromicini TaxID=2604572 RepID=A0A5D3FAE4_9ACTN|nr:hypothetical protein [Actinomadura decatromicini]TYK45183.1 hypothetical protein FXF68_31385 [Actinomadura decatromicini]
MNVRLIAGVAILALVFGGLFAACASDLGWLAATITMAVTVCIAALVIAGVILLVDGMDRR